MGFEINSLNFLSYIKRVSGRTSFNSVATMGRQSVKALPKSYWKSLSMDAGEYCEDLLIQKFGSIKVDSFDNSNYEDATFVVDMNRPIPEKIINICGTYDLIIDFGTLEHIFNVPQALWNMSTLCKTGGQIVHVLPANGWVGHGFYQFSPELFYSVYSEKNGYSGTEVFLANCDDDRYMYLVKKPINGSRSCAEGDGEAYVLVRTTKQNDEFTHDNIQQSDWVHRWGDDGPKTVTTKNQLRRLLRGIPFIVKIYTELISIYSKISRVDKICARNPSLTKFSINELLGK